MYKAQKFFITILLLIGSIVGYAQQCVHMVKRGEDFESIAQKYSITVDELKAANPESQSCYVGRKLQIPFHGVAVKRKEIKVDDPGYTLLSSDKAVLTHSAATTYQVGQALLKSNKKEQALAYLIVAADSGETRAYYPLGVYYSDNSSLQHNDKLAIYYYHKAIEASKDKTQPEYWRSCAALAQDFYEGRGVDKDLKIADKYGKEYLRYVDSSEKPKAKNLTSAISEKYQSLVADERKRKAQEIAMKKAEQAEQRRSQQQKQEKTQVTNPQKVTGTSDVASMTNSGKSNPKQKTDNYTYTAGNMTINVQTKEDGTQITTTLSPCVFCNGSKVCPGCLWTAQTNLFVLDVAQGTGYIPPLNICIMCGGKGVCTKCGGTGFSKTISFVKNGNGTIFSRDFALPIINGEALSTSSSSSGTSTDSPKIVKYIEQIKYDVPEYVNPGQEVYCEKCDKVTYKHRHEKVRVSTF